MSGRRKMVRVSAVDLRELKRRVSDLVTFEFGNIPQDPPAMPGTTARNVQEIRNLLGGLKEEP